MSDQSLVKFIPVRVNASDRRALKRWAKTQKTSVSHVLRAMIRERLERESGANPEQSVSGEAA